MPAPVEPGAPHRRLLLAATRLHLSLDAWPLASQALAEGVDLERTVSEGQRQQVLPLLYHHLHAGPLAARVPCDLLSAARKAFFASVLHTRKMHDCAGGACAALAAAGLEPVVLKGAHLGRTLYEFPALRPMADVDLLVQPSDLERALATLEDLGYTARSLHAPLDYYRKEHFHLPLHHVSRQTCIELHWGLADRFIQAGVGTERFVAAARPVDPARPELGRGLAPTWNILYLALHIAKHAVFNEHLVGRPDFADLCFEPASDNRLIWYLDLALVARDGDVDWKQVASVAHSAGILHSIRTTLAAAGILLGAGALPAAAEPLAVPRRPSLWRSWLAVGAVGTLRGGSGLRGRLARTLLDMDRRTLIRPVRLLALPDLLFPSLEALASRRSTSRRRALLAYPGHVVGVLGRGLLSAWRHFYHGLLPTGGDRT